MKTIDIKKLSENIEKRVSGDIAENNISGCSVLVNQNGKCLYKKHFGTLSAEDSTPISDRTLFRLASMTKPVTTVAVMICVERGLINLDDKIERYLPEFSNLAVVKYTGDNAVEYVKESETKPTIRHLLCHATGIGSGMSGDYYERTMPTESRKTLESAVKYYSKCGLDFEPMQRCDYSPVAGFDVLAHIVEKVSGEGFNDFVKKNIFEPCEMPDTTFVPNDDQWQRIIPMHKKENGKSSVDNLPHGYIFESYPVTHFVGGAGLISSLNDYSNFAEMLLNGGTFKGKQIITEKSVKEISTVQVPDSIMPGSQKWGLGVRVITLDEYKSLPVGAYGWSGAYGTHFWVDPVNKITAIYMKNSRHDGGSEAVTAANFEWDVTNSLE